MSEKFTYWRVLGANFAAYQEFTKACDYENCDIKQFKIFNKNYLKPFRTLKVSLTVITIFNVKTFDSELYQVSGAYFFENSRNLSIVTITNIAASSNLKYSTRAIKGISVKLSRLHVKSGTILFTFIIQCTCTAWYTIFY